MIRSTNVYSNNQTISMARKIQRLKDLGLDYDIEIGRGIGGEAVVLLSWNETEYEHALEAEENEL